VSTDGDRVAFNLATGLAGEVARMAAKPGRYAITVTATVTETSPGKGQLTYVEYSWTQHDPPTKETT
jgi:hypothetical protein